MAPRERPRWHDTDALFLNEPMTARAHLDPSGISGISLKLRGQGRNLDCGAQASKA